MNSHYATPLDIPAGIETLEILLVDVNGIIRGKQIPARQASKLWDAGDGASRAVMPRGTLFLDTRGFALDTVEYGVPDGDPDRLLLSIPDTLGPVPWAVKPTWQVLTLVADDDNHPWFLNPRCVVEHVRSALLQLKLKPVVAVELEFRLLNLDGEIPVGITRRDNSAGTSELKNFSGPQTYNLDLLADFSEFLQEVESVCHAQQLQLAGITSEYAEGQFEINLKHSANIEQACDQAVLLRRIVRHVAEKCGYFATFMAKPTVGDSGNGLHVHASLLDSETGENVFAFSGDNPADMPTVMRQSLGGLQHLMADSLALLAPNGNSFRRFIPDNFAPVHNDWGFDHRGVALRIPHERGTNTRIEHRVAGADANPYLAVAAVLASMLHGIESDLAPGPPTIGQEIPDDVIQLPARWRESLHALAGSDVLNNMLGKHFCDLYLDVKRDEEERFHQTVAAKDHQHYLRMM